MVLFAVHLNQSIKTKIVELSEIPKDVMMGISILTIIGDTEISIENHKGIIEYTDSLVKVHTKSGRIIIRGKKLFVDSYSNDEMIIKGTIHTIEFQH